MLERRDLLLVKGGADRDREVASGVQHAPATLVAGAAKSNFRGYSCDVDFLSETGTRTQGWSTLGIAASIPLTRRDTAMKGQSSKAVQTARLRIPPQGGELSSRERYSRGRGSSQSNCLGFIASEPRREFPRSGGLASVERAAGQW